MGTIYKASCENCSYDFKLSKGGGFSSYQIVCDTCGVASYAPRRAPENSNKSLHKDELIIFLSDRSQWRKYGRVFKRAELKLISNILFKCQCGGQMIPEWDSRVRYRCPKCRSTNISLTSEGTSWD